MSSSMKISITVNDFNEVDISSLRFPMLTVYENPNDYPGKFVARIYNVGTDKQVETLPFVVVKDTYAELRKAIPAGFVKIAPNKNDDPNILEIWL